ncbi:MAG: hypothetical protein ACFFD9_04735 [Candidatus Thorarchaeota archaeon]
MDENSIARQLNELLEQLDSARISIEQDHEKFRVALTGVLRLLTGGDTTLSGLKGSPEDLKGYILKLAAELSQDSTSRWEVLKSQLAAVVSQIREDADRKS